VLEFKGVSLKRGKREILNDINFCVEKEKITVLLGENAVGKSSLVSCLCEKDFKGEILLDSQNIFSLPPKQRAQRIGIMPQILPSLHLTVYELVCQARLPYHSFFDKFGKEDEEAVLKALETADALSLSSRYVDTLSGGERQRVFFALLLAQESEIAVLDEPSNNMDVSHQKRLAHLLLKMKDDGKAILSVMHDLNTAIKIADNVVILQNGKVAFFGDKEKCIQSEIIEKTFDVTKKEIDGEVIFIA
jgi:iron complex transport system ATP-binding protein